MTRLVQHTLDAAQRDIKLAVAAGIVMTVLRVGPAIALVVQGTLLDPIGYSLLCVQAVLAGVFTYGLYRRRVAAGVGLLCLWATGIFIIWMMSGMPRVHLTGVLLVYGVYRGIRGIRTLQRPRVESPAPAA